MHVSKKMLVPYMVAEPISTPPNNVSTIEQDNGRKEPADTPRLGVATRKWQGLRCFPKAHHSNSIHLFTDTCADCKARNPRWASYNLGIFIWCANSVPSRVTWKLMGYSVHCASIHRKIGTHITKVYVLSFPSKLLAWFQLSQSEKA